jgi:hypothetical protein
MNSAENCCQHCGKPLASGLGCHNCGAPCEPTPLVLKILSLFSFLVLEATGGFVIYSGHYSTYSKYTHQPADFNGLSAIGIGVVWLSAGVMFLPFLSDRRTVRGRMLYVSLIGFVGGFAILLLDKYALA